MKSIIFNNGPETRGLGGFLARTQPIVEQFAFSAESREVGKNLLNVESISNNPAIVGSLQTTASQLLNKFESFAAESFGVTGKDGRITHNYNQNQLKAATIAAMLGHDLKGALSAPTKPTMSLEGITVSPVADSTPFERRAANEAYDEQSTSTSIAFSVAYNLECARQSELAETLFPTVVIPPNEAGLFMSIDLALLQNDSNRAISGAVTDFKRYNVIRAQTYPELLQNDASDLVPVLRDDSKQFFVPDTAVAPIVRKMDNGEDITTSYLKTGAKFDLLSISHTDTMVAKGLPNQTDSIDPGVFLEELLIAVHGTVDGTATTEYIAFNVKELPQAAYYAASQGDYKDQQLSFQNSSLLVNGNTKTVSGAASVLLAPIGAGNYEVRLAVDVSGRLNLQFGNGSVYGPAPEVATVAKNGVQVSATSGPGATIAALFAGAEVVGYKLAAKRSNLNRRLRGQTMDTNTKRQFYPLNLLAPVTIVRPHSAGDVNDARDLSFLIFTTKTRSSIDAVEVLQAHAATMRAMQGQFHIPGETVETFGLARWLLDPYYAHDEYNAPEVVDSIKSSERAADIQASLVNLIRDHVYKMWQLSSYGPASASQNGGVAQIPTVIIACDPRIEQYLNITGDLRLLGDKFPVKVVSDTNKNLRGKLYVTFGNMETAAQGIPNVLHFGTTMYRPEMTIILPVSRDGQTSKEITVSPAFRHFVNLPLLIEIDVTGIEDVVDAKVPVFMHTA
jgi:hypothetical protein